MESEYANMPSLDWEQYTLLLKQEVRLLSVMDCNNTQFGSWFYLSMGLFTPFVIIWQLLPSLTIFSYVATLEDFSIFQRAQYCHYRSNRRPKLQKASPSCNKPYFLSISIWIYPVSCYVLLCVTVRLSLHTTNCIFPSNCYVLLQR